MVPDTLFQLFYGMLAEGANKAYQCRSLRNDEDDVPSGCRWRRHILIPSAHTRALYDLTNCSVFRYRTWGRDVQYGF